MWVEITPRRMDFCGQVGCPLCYAWRAGDNQPSMSGIEKIALDLIQKRLDELTADQRKELNGIARKIHKHGLGAFAGSPDESPPPDAAADIGMSTAAQIDGWLRERRRTEAPKPRALNCDAIADRQAAREAEAKRKQKERDERLKEAREIAAVFATAQREQDERRQYEEQRYLRGIDPGFVSYCRERGIRDPQEIAYRWQRERGPSAMMFDPNEPIMPMGNRPYGY